MKTLLDLTVDIDKHPTTNIARHYAKETKKNSTLDVIDTIDTIQGTECFRLGKVSQTLFFFPIIISLYIKLLRDLLKVLGDQ